MKAPIPTALAEHFPRRMPWCARLVRGVGSALWSSGADAILVVALGEEAAAIRLVGAILPDMHDKRVAVAALDSGA